MNIFNKKGSHPVAFFVSFLVCSAAAAPAGKLPLPFFRFFTQRPEFYRSNTLCILAVAAVFLSEGGAPFQLRHKPEQMHKHRFQASVFIFFYR